MIDYLIAELGEKLDLTAEELADVIWLTLIRQEGTLTKVLEPKIEAAAIVKPDKVDAPVLSIPPRTAPSAQRPAPVESVAGIVSHRSSTTNTVLDRLPIKVANPPSLRNPLALARSLRPLMQQVPSGRVEGLDEQATAQQIAEAGIWQPIVKPALEPWLEIALVADESASMLIWRQTVLEFRKLLRNYGAFRDVQLWGLHCEGEHLCLRPGIGSDALQQPTRQPEELLNPNGRRLILLITDCVSSYWQEEALIKTLKRWAQQSPIAIAQVLPEWLWVRTAIRGFESVQLAGLEPGVPNSQLVVDWSSAWQSVSNTQSGVCLPIVPLEPDSVLTWSQMVMGQREAPGYWLRPFPTETDLPASSSRSPAQQLERFELISSPVAQRLMGLVAASPVITLPVIRLIQEALLPKSQQMHVAEVLLGGLLEPITPPNLETIPDEMEYRFVDEAIRDLLLAETLVPDTVQVLSGYIERQFDQSLDDFIAELQLWSQNEDIALVNKARSFATVTAAVLKRKGGRYREFVQLVERQYQHHAVEDIAPFPSVMESDQQKVMLTLVWVCEWSVSAHEENVTCICFSPDGLLIASSSDDRTIRLWNLQGNQLAQFVGHSGLVHFIVISPNGKHIISTSSDATVRVWNLSTGNLLRTLVGHTASVLSVACSPDGKTIVSSSDDTTVRVWDLSTGNLLRTLVGHTASVWSVACSPDGKTIVSGSDDTTVRVWDLSTGNLLRTLVGHTASVWSVACSPDGKTIVSGSDDKTVRVWDLSTGQGMQTLLGHTDTIYSVAFSPDGQTLVSGSRDRMIRVWTRDGSPIGNPLEGHKGGVNSVAFSPDGCILASCSGDKSIKLWKQQEAEVTAVEPDVLGVLILDEPGGQVPLDSVFYIERPPIEARCYEAIVKPGALLRITAPRQMGKSSLMARILRHAEEQGCIPVMLSFQMAEAAVFSDLNRFLKWFCASVGRRLRLPNKPEDNWDNSLSSLGTCTDYFEDLLTEISSPLVLCLDEVDMVFNQPKIGTDFFAMLRGWHEYSGSKSVWTNLRLVIGYSEEVYISHNINQSPFNVGVPIKLPQWTQPQVMELVHRHELNWSEAELTKLMGMVGGHPYLVRVALHQIARGEVSLDQFLQIAPTDNGLYGDHLRHHLLNLEENEKLLAAMQQVVASDQPVSISATEEFKLVNMGLVQRQGLKVAPTCDLYRHYFQERLVTSDEESLNAAQDSENALSPDFIITIEALKLSESRLSNNEKQRRQSAYANYYENSIKNTSRKIRFLNQKNCTTQNLNKLKVKVKTLKNALTELGFYSGEINDKIDELLIKSLTLFQQRQGLEPPDGICGSLTLIEIYEVINSTKNQPYANAPKSKNKEQFLETELRIALAIVDEPKRIETLIDLIEQSPETPSNLLHSLSIIENEADRVSVLIALIPRLPNTVLSNALEIVRTIQNTFSRFQGLAFLAALLPEIVPEALQAGLEIEDESIRLRALTSVAEKLPPELLPQALEAALRVDDAFSRARALIALMNKLPNAIPQALKASLEIQDDYSRACALGELAPYLPTSLLPDVLDAALAIHQKAARNDLLRDLIPLLPENLRQRINLVEETPSRISLWQKGNTQIYALCTSTPWNLQLDALVIPVGYQGGLGNLAAAFQEFLGISSKWLSQAISAMMRVNKLKRIKPRQPLLVKLPSKINAQVSSLVGSTSERFIICATSESEDDISSSNTSVAYEAVVRLAVDRRFRRIVVSLIGTGLNQLPVDEVATGMLRAINDVLKSLQHTNLEEITIVDRDEDKIAAITRISHIFSVSKDEPTRREEEIERAMAAFEAAVESAAYEDEQEDTPPRSHSPKVNIAPAIQTSVLEVNSPEVLRETRPNVPKRSKIDDYTQAELIALIRWILSDGCLRTDEEILREMVLELGFKRRGARIDKAVQAAIKRMGSSR